MENYTIFVEQIDDKEWVARTVPEFIVVYSSEEEKAKLKALEILDTYEKRFLKEKVI